MFQTGYFLFLIEVELLLIDLASFLALCASIALSGAAFVMSLEVRITTFSQRRSYHSDRVEDVVTDSVL